MCRRERIRKEVSVKESKEIRLSASLYAQKLILPLHLILRGEGDLIDLAYSAGEVDHAASFGQIFL